MADVFISYKAERRPAVHYLARVLENHGFSVWFDYALSNASLPKGPEKTHSDREAIDKWWSIPVILVVLVGSGIAIYSRTPTVPVDAPGVEEAAAGPADVAKAAAEVAEAAADDDPAPKVRFDAEAFARVGPKAADGGYPTGQFILSSDEIFRKGLQIVINMEATK